MKDLTKGNIKRHLYELALPTVGGLVAFSLFNITDTYFVGKLGIDAMAAMGFTFPIVMIVGALSAGISTGASSLVARAYGDKDKSKMQAITTDGILLSLLLVSLLSIIGLLTMDPLFKFMGADSQILPMIKSYMTIWYGSVIVVLTPQLSDGAMRSVGDTIRPFKIMLICAFVNIVLDPILIFGWFGLPAMGIQGAAIATVFSRLVGMIVSLYYTHKVHNLIRWKKPVLKDALESWSGIIAIGLPSAVVALLPQNIRITMTSFAARLGGSETVAALAIGSRIEGFMLIIAIATGISIVPLVGQNYGAGLQSRVIEIQKTLSEFAVIIASIVFVFILLVSKPLIGLFTSNSSVASLTFYYLLIMACGAMGVNLYNFNSQILNGLGLSKRSLMINASGTFLVILPLMILGAQFSFISLCIGLAIGQLLLGVIAAKLTHKTVQSDISNSNLKAVKNIG